MANEKRGNPLDYFKGVGRELKRVRWPSRDQYLSSMAVVLVITILAG